MLKIISFFLLSTLLFLGCASSIVKYPGQSLLNLKANVEQCSDEICGLWRISFSGFNYKILIVPSSDPEWQYEGVIYDPGNVRRFSFVAGEVVFKWNKVSRENYAGGCLWKSAIASLGFHESNLTMRELNGFTILNQPPSGPIAGGTIMGGRRIGVKTTRFAGGDIEGGKKVVQVSGGTGFLFSSKDYIITNWHVVKGAGSILAKFTNGETVEAKVVAKDLKNDIAVLKLAKAPPLSATQIKLGDSSQARMGERIFTIGYPASKIMGEKPKYSEGVINALTGLKDDPAFFQISVPVQPGNSGGPLFNERGEVIGITTASLSLLAIEAMGAIPQNVNYAIKSSFVKNLLSTIPELMLSNTGIVVVPNEPEKSLPNFIEQVSKNIVLIEAKE